MTLSSSIGFASALIASSALLISLSDFGISVSILRYQTLTESPSALVNVAIRMALLLSSLAVLIFIVGLSSWTPALSTLRQSISLTALFFAYTASNMLMAYQDMAMLGVGKPQFVFWRTIACNVPPLLLLVGLLPLLNTGTVVVYAFMLPNVIVAIYTSSTVLPKALPGYRSLGTFDIDIVKRIWRYGLLNHVSNILWALPAYLLPILAVTWDSLNAGGIFAIVWALTGATFIVPRSVSTALFARMSQDKASRRHLIFAAGAIIFGLGLPMILMLWLVGPFLLGLFGKAYIESILLNILLLSYIPFAINTIFFSLLRVSKQTGWIAIFSAIYAASMISALYICGKNAGIQGIAIGWLVGSTFAVIPGLLILVLSENQIIKKIHRGGRAGLFILIALILCGNYFSPPMLPAHAEATEENMCAIEQINHGRLDLLCDLDGDGVMSDRVAVVLRQGKHDSQVAWNDPVLLEGTTWLFDYGANETVELAIVFNRQEESLTARLYSMPSSEQVNSLTSPDDNEAIDLVGFPDVKVVARDGWWVDGKKINFNLDIEVDGPIVSAFIAKNIFDTIFVRDGIIDANIRIRDTNNNGHPDYDWRTVNFPEPRPAIARGITPSNLMVNARDDEMPFKSVLPWPYLGPLTYGYVTNSPQVTGPPIQIDWTEGRVAAIGEFVRSRANDGQWFVYSTRLLEGASLNTPNFESPFAWYDLAEDGDRAPELSIRLVYYKARDPDFLKGTISDPRNVVRYSWDLDNDGAWDFKLGLFGRDEIDTTVSLPDLSLKLISYEELPSWVTSKKWETAIFVASQEGASGEGIYEWDFTPWMNEMYFTGESESILPPRESKVSTAKGDLFNELDEIGIGFRGEYQMDYHNQPILYFSPIDNQLHLKWAEYGIWRLDNEQIIRVFNLDGDGFIDKWTREKMPLQTKDEPPSISTDKMTWAENSGDSQAIETLYAFRGYLLHAGDGMLTLVEADYQSALFETLPPTDQNTWEAQRALLAPYKDQRRDPSDLRSWLNPFSGPRSEIANASAANVRIIEDGFRFELTLAPGYQVNGPDLLGVAGLTPGKYVVESRDGAFMVTPQTPAQLSLAVRQATVGGAPSPLQITVANSGGADMRDLTLVVETQDASGKPVELARTTVQALAGQSTQVRVDLPSTLATGATLRVRQEDSQGQVVARGEWAPLVGSSTPPRAAITSPNQVPILAPVAVLFAVFVGMGAALALRRRPGESTR